LLWAGSVTAKVNRFWESIGWEFTVLDVLRESDPASRRRSTRVAQALPIIVQGEDSNGRPFKEHTFTVSINCHGCRFQSKHNLEKDARITVQIPHRVPGKPARISRGRITWVTPPRSTHERYQVGLELESIGNIWGMAFPPEDWFPYSEPAPSALSKSDASATQKISIEAMDRAVYSMQRDAAVGPTLIAGDLKPAQSLQESAIQSAVELSSPQRSFSDPTDRLAGLEESAAKRINSIVEAASSRLDQQSAALAATLRESLARSSADAENSIGAVCAHLDEDIIQARSLLSEVKSAAEVLQETSNKFDALRRTATEELKWHEKRIENQVQLTMEKTSEEAVRVLSEKASEVIARFGEQLESLSHTFVEHTRSHLEESSRTTAFQSREIIQQMVESGAASLRLEAQRTADSVKLLAGSADHSMAQESEVSAQDLVHSRAAAEDATIEDFKRRLEDASSAWLVSTIAILEDRTQKSLEGVVKTFADRLRKNDSD
jgi:predicted transcriptional regulator YheO